MCTHHNTCYTKLLDSRSGINVNLARICPSYFFIHNKIEIVYLLCVIEDSGAYYAIASKECYSHFLSTSLHRTAHNKHLTNVVL